MPTCRYTLHIHSINGPAADFAKVGDPVFHRWQCDTGGELIRQSSDSDLYAMKVKNCFVDDGKSRRFLLIDENGWGTIFALMIR